VPANSADVSERAQKQEQSAKADNSSCKKMRIAIVQILLYYHFFSFEIVALRMALLQKPFPDREGGQSIERTRYGQYHLPGLAASEFAKVCRNCCNQGRYRCQNAHASGTGGRLRLTREIETSISQKIKMHKIQQKSDANNLLPTTDR
jgi:hypothetical protein